MSPHCVWAFIQAETMVTVDESSAVVEFDQAGPVVFELASFVAPVAEEAPLDRCVGVGRMVSTMGQGLPEDPNMNVLPGSVAGIGSEGLGRIVRSNGILPSLTMTMSTSPVSVWVI